MVTFLWCTNKSTLDLGYKKVRFFFQSNDDFWTTECKQNKGTPKYSENIDILRHRTILRCFRPCTGRMNWFNFIQNSQESHEKQEFQNRERLSTHSIFSPTIAKYCQIHSSTLSTTVTVIYTDAR